MDPKISKKLSELVLSGVRNEKEMKEKLDVYINQELYPGKAKPLTCNKRYFPSTHVIKMKMFNDLVLQRLTMLDCSQIDKIVAEIQNRNEDDMIYCRRFEGKDKILHEFSYKPSDEELGNDEIRVRQKLSEQQFIFVHQTSFQRHLLQRYGNHVCFLDPVYRTVKYPLPLFFLIVKTNVDYQAVATFVVQDENMESTKEALQFIKAWNPEWKPKVFMVDNDSEEITLVQQCFPGLFQIGKGKGRESLHRSNNHFLCSCKLCYIIKITFYRIIVFHTFITPNCSCSILKSMEIFYTLVTSPYSSQIAKYCLAISTVNKPGNTGCLNHLTASLHIRTQS